MLFEVDPCTNSTLDVEQRAVNWIKEFRYQTGLGLRESKDVCDFVRLCKRSGEYGSANGRVIIDTSVYTKMKFLDDWVKTHRNVSMIRMVNFDIAARTTSREQHARLTGNTNQKPKAPVKPNDVLKNTAIRLIRMGAISEARDVLKILM